jgi:hypothetical protein
LQRRSLLLRNPNRHSRLIALQMAPDYLRSLPEYLQGKAISNGEKAPVHPDLAVQPVTLAEGLDLLITHMVPRESHGERMAAYQGALLRNVEWQVYRLLGIRPNRGNPGEQPALVQQLYRDIIAATEKTYPHYREFRAALTPLLTQLNRAAEELPGAIRSFMPPHIYMLRAAAALQQNGRGQIIGWQYIGHGIHRRMLRTRKTAMVLIPSGAF